MAIAKMLLFKLVGTTEEQDKLLDALHRTGAVELKQTSDLFDGKRLVSDKTELYNKQASLEKAIDLISKCIAEAKSEKGEPDGFGVSYSEFMKISERESEICAQADKVSDLSSKIYADEAAVTAYESKIKEFLPYALLKTPFSEYVNTKKTRCVLGIIENKRIEEFMRQAEENGLIFVSEECESDSGKVVSVTWHESVSENVEKLLSSNAFIRCPFSFSRLAKDEILELKQKIRQKKTEITELKQKITEFSGALRDLKTLSDYYSFVIQKKSGEDGFLRTASAYVLEAYVPEERKDQVLNAVKGVTNNYYAEFTPIAENEYAPTLMKNKGVTKQFEFVTNLYSPPKYLSFDPNFAVMLFFSLFMGFINGDMGYGFLMLAGGILFAKAQKRDTSMRRLALILAFSGIFTIIFGVLFDSLFGIPILRNAGLISKPFLPDPVYDNSVVAGISIPSLLLISLGMGVVHIMAGLFITALIHFAHGRILDGIFDGLIWDVFLGGIIVLVVGLTGLAPAVTKPAVLVIVVSVAIGAIFAGRHEKGFGKITKAFGSVYGLINYMSDILSYARLYGLMLSGAQIASIVSNQLALPMLTSPGGAGGFIACALIMLIGHVFNMAMGLLGAFVHDARLQYVEFFSRFYEGEGQLFTPFATKFDHVYLK